MESMLQDLSRVAERIASLELYSFLLEDIRSRLGNEQPSGEQIAELLRSEPELLAEYRRLNRDNEISNIDLASLSIRSADDEACTSLRREINRLREDLLGLERFSGPPSLVMYSIWVGFAVILLLFLAHNLFAIYTAFYETFPALVFSTYAVLSFGGVGAVVFMMRRHRSQRRRFEQTGGRLEALIRKALDAGCVTGEELHGQGGPTGS